MQLERGWCRFSVQPEGVGRLLFRQLHGGTNHLIRSARIYAPTILEHDLRQALPQAVSVGVKKLGLKGILVKLKRRTLWQV